MLSSKRFKRKCVLGCPDAIPIFKFPDVSRPENAERRKQWLKLMNIDEPPYCDQPKVLYACYRHFSLKVRSTTRLYANAVPDCNIPPQDTNKPSPQTSSSSIHPVLILKANASASNLVLPTKMNTTKIQPLSTSVINPKLILPMEIKSETIESSLAAVEPSFINNQPELFRPEEMPAEYDEKALMAVVGRIVQTDASLSANTPRKLSLRNDIKNLREELKLVQRELKAKEKQLKINENELIIKEIQIQVKDKALEDINKMLKTKDTENKKLKMENKNLLAKIKQTTKTYLKDKIFVKK